MNITKFNKKIFLIIILIFFIFINGIHGINTVTGADTFKKTDINLNESKKPVKLSQNSIITASNSVDNYLSKKGKLPNYVKISNYKFSMPEFMYLLSKTVEYKYKKNGSEVTVKHNIKNPTHPKGVAITGDISAKDYYKYSVKVAKYITRFKLAPNNITTPLGEMQYQTIIYSYIKILEGETLPENLTLNIGQNKAINSYLPNYMRSDTPNTKVLNSKYNGESLQKYLKATRGCQVKDIKIKTLANKITKGCKTKQQKARAIFNWVVENIESVFYYNTKYGAKKTISKKEGNCVDQSHLFIALCRSKGIPARYVHGRCKFVTSGNTYGHVWTQVLIGKTWIVADPSHAELNGFGDVNNWNVNSYKVYRKYSQIPF